MVAVIIECVPVDLELILAFYLFALFLLLLLLLLFVCVCKVLKELCTFYYLSKADN